MNPAFQSAGYRRLWLNATVNATSYGGDFVLVGWMALAVTGTSAWVGTAFALYYLPMVLLGLPAGGLADRVDRRRLIQVLELLAAVVIAAFAVLFRFEEPDLPGVLAFTLCLGSLRAVHNPARLSFAYDLVGGQLITPALAGMTLGVRLGMLAGALLTGTLAERAGLTAALSLMAAAHIAAFLCLAGRFNGGARRRAEPSPILRDLLDYLRELRANRVLLVLTLVTALIEVFGVSLYTLLPELAEARLDRGAEGLGWMHAAQACGGFVMSALIFLLPPGGKKAAPYAGSILCLGVSLVALGAVEGLVAVLLILALISAMIAAWDILTQSMMQLCVSDRLRGRAMGTWVFAIGSAPLGHLEIGFLAAALGVETALYVNGLAVIAIIATVLVIAPAVRRF